MDEVLAFRKEHFREHRAYVRSVRKLTRDLAQLPIEEREEELRDRREELLEIANDLKTVSRKAWRRPAGFALGMAGAFWKLKGIDYMGMLLAAAGALVALKSKEKAETGAYSYLFRAQSQLW
jgi:hypothetical protein